MENHRRSIVKATTYRLLGSLSTFLISWFFTGRVEIAGAISAVEFVSKIGLFYFHERAWLRISWGANRSPTKQLTPNEHTDKLP